MTARPGRLRNTSVRIAILSELITAIQRPAIYERRRIAIPGSGSVFLHSPMHAVMVVYVDDMLLLA